MRAAAGTAPSSDSGQPEAPEFVWYGQTYKCQDLHEALAILSDPAVDTASAVDANQSGMSSGQQSEDVWQLHNWKSMSSDAQLLLQRLSACRSYIPQVMLTLAVMIRSVLMHTRTSKQFCTHCSTCLCILCPQPGACCV